MSKKLKDFFIPHEGNEYKPHSLQKLALTGMVVMVLLSFSVANLQSVLWVTSDWLVSTVLPAVIVDLTNEERDDASLVSLSRNATLDEAARLKAQHMAENEYFAHFSPDGVSPWYWFAEADYNFVHAGENLAIHFTDSGEVVDAWMDSPTHRANIMNGDYTEIGVGTAEGSYDGYNTVYVVQLFGTPAATQAVAGATVVEAEPEPETEPVVLAVAEPEPVSEPEPTPALVPEPVEEPQAVLAEEVILTEDVEIIPADPEPVMVETPVVAEMEVTENGVALFSGHVSTSTGAIPATAQPETTGPTSEAPYAFELLVSPQLLLQVLYVMIGLFVVGALLLSMLIEIRQQHPVQVAYSIALLALMTGLFYVHSTLSSGALII